MIGGKGGLGIKDYPFAFSVAALILPTLWSEGQIQFTTLFAITIIGGMLGSILTIVNPVGVFFRAIYINSKMSDVLPNLRKNPLMNGIIDKNFRAALTSPSISYETDKIVGMLYFLAVLGFAIYRLQSEDFVSLLPFDQNQIDNAINGAGVGFVAVFLVWYFHVAGFNIGGFRSISHTKRIETVTVLNAALEITNLSNDGRKIWVYHYNRKETSDLICNELNKLDSKSMVNFSTFEKYFDDVKIKNEFLKLNLGKSWDSTTQKHSFWNSCVIINEIRRRFSVKFTEALVWMSDNHYLGPQELDVSVSQLQTSTESRDWQNANLKTFRITDRLEQLLEQKRMPKNWNEIQKK